MKNGIYPDEGQGGYSAGGQKFCAQCGHKLDPGSRFCPKCGAFCAAGGSGASRQPGGGGVYTPPSKPIQFNHMVSDGSPRGRLNELCGGTLSLVFVGLYTLGVLIQFFANLSAIFSSGIGILIQLPAQALVILLAIGFCMNAWGARTGQMRDTGFTLISGVLLTRTIVIIVSCSLGAVGSLIVTVVAMANIRDGFMKLLGVLLLQLVLLAAVLFLLVPFYRGLRNTALSAREIVRTGSGSIQTSKYSLVMLCIAVFFQFIFAVSAASVASVLSRYSSLLSYAGYDLFGDLFKVNGAATFATVLLVAAQVIAVVILFKLRGAGQNTMIPPAAQSGNRYGQYY